MKYRVWVKKHREYWGVLAIDFEKSEVLVGRPFVDNLRATRTFNFEDVQFERYIGIKSKINQDIYEHDIVKWFEYDGGAMPKERTGIIEFRNTTQGLGWHVHTDFEYLAITGLEYFEVIGNKNEGVKK